MSKRWCVHYERKRRGNWSLTIGWGYCGLIAAVLLAVPLALAVIR